MEAVELPTPEKPARLFCADCREVMRSMPADCIDAVVTDPPYGLSFMGKDWDHGVPGVAFWQDCLRVAKPGAPLLAFGGTRTHHRLMVAVEDAGWEIRDCIMWVYGSGFPKSLDISKAIDRRKHDREQTIQVTGWIREARDAAGLTNPDIDKAFGFNGMSGHWTSQGSQPAVPTLEQVPKLLELIGVEDPPEEIATLLWDLNAAKGKPGPNWWKRDVVGESSSVPISHSFAGDRYGDNQERTTASQTNGHTPAAQQWQGWGTALKPAWEPIIVAMKPVDGTFADNAIKHGVAGLNIDGARVGAEERHHSSAGSNDIYGQFKGSETEWRTVQGRWPANVIHDGSDEVVARFPQSKDGTAVGWGASSIYGTQMEQCDESKHNYGGEGSASRFFYCAKASSKDREEDNKHPTVKPQELMRYLVKLVGTPTGGTVLDPFMGSGSTGVACARLDRMFIGCDIDGESFTTAKQRIVDVRGGMLF